MFHILKLLSADLTPLLDYVIYLMKWDPFTIQGTFFTTFLFQTKGFFPFHISKIGLKMTK